jgi:probable HAF family extracellular repeat protein
MKRSPLSRIPGAAVMALVLFLASCREGGGPTAPSVQARGGNGLTVSSVVPDNSKRGVTLDITVNGSGFDQGSSVRLERQGVPAGGITTNATTFVSSKKLTANITIAATADTGKYDVAVTTSGGRKGVGIELFLVEYELAELGIIGGTWSRAHAINDLGEVVGASCTSDCLATAFYWTEASGQVALPGLPGYSRGGAYAITNGRQVFGDVSCRAEDPGCGGVFKKQLVRWDRSGSSWTITPVQGCSTITIVGDSDYRFLINNNQQCVARKPSGSLALQTLSGGSVVSEETLPKVGPNSDWAYGINDAAMVAGYGSGSGLQPIVWYRRQTGWAVIRLPLADKYEWGRATDLSQPDAAGRVWVSGFIQDTDSRDLPQQPVRWTLIPDGLGGFTVGPPELLEIPFSQLNYRGGAAVAISSAGAAVGKFGGYAGAGAPALWPVGTSSERLPSLQGNGDGRAADINSQGWIVGAVWDAANACERAAIWRQR